MLSEISSLSLDIVIIYDKPYFSSVCPRKWNHIGWSKTQKGGECRPYVQKHSIRFETLDEVHKKRNFSLGLHLDVPGSMVERAMRKMEWDVKACRDGELGYLLSKPIISTIPSRYRRGVDL